MKIVFAGGKTGGHLYPGIALAQHFKDKGCDVCFFSTYAQLDKDILKTQNIKNFPIKSYPITLKNIIKNFMAGLQALYYLLKVNPCIVIGLGGYPSALPVFMAKLLGKRIFLLEQNVKMGKANLFLSKFADKVFLAFKESLDYCKNDKFVYTGNPIRKEVQEVLNFNKKDICNELKLDTEKKIVLIIGGSQGARIINETVIDIVEEKEDIQFIHVTGKDNFEQIKNKYQKTSNIKLISFTNDLGKLMYISDLIISRAGGGVVSELMFLNKKSILIPFFNAKENHQLYNAQVLEKQGRASIIEEKDLNKDVLKEKLLYFLDKNNNKIFYPDAKEEVFRFLFGKHIQVQE